MAENKMGPNLQAGAGIFAKRLQKSMNRAQEKVLQKLGKTMETKDEQFEVCVQSLNKQQGDGNRLFKDVKAYHAAVKDLLWNDYEEKLSDQIVRTMENYTSQFPEVKADEEFNKSQNVFEEINTELREELPVLYQSRIGCYVTLNHELYNVMKKLETQHSGKAFIIKGLHSTSKAKKRKSLVISNPIPCNTAFPTDHVSIHTAGGENGKDTVQGSEENAASSSKDSSDSEFSFSGSNSPQRQSVCEQEETESLNQEEVEVVEDELAETSPMTLGSGCRNQRLQIRKCLNPVRLQKVNYRRRRRRRRRGGGSGGGGNKPPLLPAKEEETEEASEASDNQEKADSGEDSTSHNPPGFLYRRVALESHAASEDGALQFEQGDVILVLNDTQQVGGSAEGIREESWKQNQDLKHSGIFSEKLLQPEKE
ncbi:hypothetical protein F7725_016486 [Dissostichus mawsoni]|uniref:BAR domain-containing protein n=1 Tax=Dissostichus mawsoni TaxID=36200 RepID=A0A7J5Z2M2_DISMA|nr:hypothetical protein F7725_016486 [Dissostichus mawsoni]